MGGMWKIEWSMGWMGKANRRGGLKSRRPESVPSGSVPASAAGDDA